MIIIIKSIYIAGVCMYMFVLVCASISMYAMVIKYPVSQISGGFHSMWVAIFFSRDQHIKQKKKFNYTLR